MSLKDSNPFSLFQKEGGVYGVRTGKDKLRKFIPNSPQEGLDNAFGSEDPLLRNGTAKRGRGRPRKNQPTQGSYF